MIRVNKLRGRMKEMGYSQKEMAKILDIHEQTFGGYLKSEVIPSDKIEKIAQILDINDYNFFFDINPNVTGIE